MINMNNEQDNLNQNNFSNSQDNGVMPNNQDIVVNETILNQQAMQTSPQSINQTNLQQPMTQNINTFDVGSVNNNHKISKKINIGLIIGTVSIIGVIGVASSILLFSNSNKQDKGKINNTTINSSQNNSESENLPPIENKLISGAEYYDTKRDIDGVTNKNFSFFIGNDFKILTYINKDENSKIKMGTHCFRENSVSVTFDVNNFEVIVSDNKYHVGGNAINLDNKTFIKEEKNIKYYTTPYKNGYYIHYFETNIDGIAVSFYSSNKLTKNDDLFKGIVELASKLSKNDRVGLWADWELSNNYARNGIALKSSKLFSLLPATSSSVKDKIVINGIELSVMFSVYSWKGTSVNENSVVLGEIANQKYGYYIYEDGIRFQIYTSEIVGETEKYTNQPTIIYTDHFKETNLTAEQYVEMILKNIIEIQET